METLTAAVVLAWLVLTVLAFAMAGLLHQLRDVQAVISRQRPSSPSGITPHRQLPESVRPHDNKTYATLLLVDETCPVCSEVAPTFAEVALAGPDDIDFAVLSDAPSHKWEVLNGVRSVADSAAFHLLDPGWRPAIIVVDAKGEVLAAEPAGSTTSVRAVVEHISGRRAVG